MSNLVVHGGTPLRGRIHPSANKNAVLPVLCATLLTNAPLRLLRVPDITDVRKILDIFRTLGSNVRMDHATGTLELSWLEGSRPDIFGGGYKGDQSYEVWLGTSLLGTFSTSSGQDFTARNVTASVTGGSSYYLIFHGLSQGDNTAFLDDVSASITPSVPEPATWAMLIAGFFATGGAIRRRRGAAFA